MENKRSHFVQLWNRKDVGKLKRLPFVRYFHVYCLTIVSYFKAKIRPNAEEKGYF